jgi:hypothetical protein
MVKLTLGALLALFLFGTTTVYAEQLEPRMQIEETDKSVFEVVNHTDNTVVLRMEQNWEAEPLSYSLSGKGSLWIYCHVELGGILIYFKEDKLESYLGYVAMPCKKLVTVNYE